LEGHFRKIAPDRGSFLLWVTRHEPHVDRCASAWLIKNFIDRDALFEFISKDSPIPKGATAFTLPSAEIRPVEGQSTTFDVLVEKFKVKDPIIDKIRELLHDFEITVEEDISKVEHSETSGVCLILRGLARTSKTDHEIVTKAMTVMDALYSELKERAKQA
jgi:hypothetical protein